MINAIFTGGMIVGDIISGSIRKQNQRKEKMRQYAIDFHNKQVQSQIDSNDLESQKLTQQRDRILDGKLYGQDYYARATNAQLSNKAEKINTEINDLAKKNNNLRKEFRNA